MTVTQEAARRKLYHWIADNLGDEEADAIMAAIPTINWDDLVTNDQLRTEFGALRSELKDEMHAGFARVDAAMRVQLMWMIATMIAMTGVVIAAFAALD